MIIEQNKRSQYNTFLLVKLFSFLRLLFSLI